MKYANKTGAKFVMVLGDNEIESGVAKLKKHGNRRADRYQA